MMNGDRITFNERGELIGSAEAFPPNDGPRARTPAKTAQRKRNAARRAEKRAANRAAGLTSDGRVKTH